MTLTNAPYRFVSNKCALMALSILLVASQGALAGTTIIYKCLDRNLGLVYTDEPCKDGERMAIRAGDADPSAVARLERERESLDRSAAQRIADERRARARGLTNVTTRIAPPDLPTPWSPRTRKTTPGMLPTTPAWPGDTLPIPVH